MFDLGSLFVTIGARTAAFNAALDGVKARLVATSTQMSAFAAHAAGMLSLAAFGAIGYGLVKAVKGASDLNESVSKMEFIYGAASKKMMAETEDLAAKFGIVKREFIDGAVQMGRYGTAAGKTKDQAAEMGTHLAKLSLDLMSQENISYAQSLDVISSAMSGEIRAIRSRGAFLSEELVAQEAVRMGLEKRTQHISEANKIMARMSLIEKSLADMNGDLARTIDQPANAWRRFTGNLTNTGVAIGAVLMPSMMRLLNGLSSMAAAIRDTFEARKGAITGWLNTAANAFVTFRQGIAGIIAKLAELPGNIARAIGPGPTGMIMEFGDVLKKYALDILDGIAFAWRNLPKLVDLAVLMITEKIINLGEVLATIPANLKLIGSYVAGNWKAIWWDTNVAVFTMIKNLLRNLIEVAKGIVTVYVNIAKSTLGIMQGSTREALDFLKDPLKGVNPNWTPLLDGFKATAGALPTLIKAPLTSMQDQIKAKSDEIAADELKRSQEIAARLKGGAGGATGAAGEHPLDKEIGKGFKSEETGIAEFARKLRQQQSGGTKNVPAQQLAVQKDALKVAQSTQRLLERGVPARMA